MKNVLSFLFILLIFASCSNWKYGGKSKPQGGEVKYVEVVLDKNKVDPIVFDISTPDSRSLAVENGTALQKKSIYSKSIIKLNDSVKSEVEKDNSWIPYQDKVVENEDSLRRQDEILAQVVKTEREAKKSTVFGIIGTVLSITPAFIVGFFFSISALKKSTSALRERYITPKGLKHARIGLIFSIIGLVLSSILILILFFALLVLLAFL